MVPVPVPIINDMIVEGNETFVGLLDAQGQPVIVDPPREQAIVLITEDPTDGMCRHACMYVHVTNLSFMASTKKKSVAGGKDCACLKLAFKTLVVTGHLQACLIKHYNTFRCFYKAVTKWPVQVVFLLLLF